MSVYHTAALDLYATSPSILRAPSYHHEARVRPDPLTRPPAHTDFGGTTVITGDLRKLLIAQIGSELTAHQLYLAISVYFDRASLRGWGKLFKDQSIEEAQHAQKIMDFLTDNEIEFDLPALKATTTRFSSPLAAAQRALQSERDVAIQFDRMAAIALKAGDHRG